MLTVAVSPVLFLYVVRASVVQDCVLPEKQGNLPDYYWRDYVGVIPKDAVPGGYGEDGNVTYISQVPSPSYPGIFPGSIYPGRKDTVVCARERAVVEKNVKILCAHHRERFEWVATTADESHLLTDYHWVVGGSTFYSTFYVGRARFEGEVQIGRVFDSTSKFKGFYLCKKTGKQIKFQSFELLVVAK